MLRIQLEQKTLDNSTLRNSGISASLSYYDGILQLFMESHLEKWQRLSAEDTAKLLKAMDINEKNEDEMKNTFLKIFNKEAVTEKGSEEIFLELCRKYDVKPEYGAYFIDSR